VGNALGNCVGRSAGPQCGRRTSAAQFARGGRMKSVGCIVVLAALAAGAPTLAAERPDWAFPVTEKVLPPSRDDGKPKTAPGSTLALTRDQIDDLFNAPDWF